MKQQEKTTTTQQFKSVRSFAELTSVLNESDFCGKILVYGCIDCKDSCLVIRPGVTLCGAGKKPSKLVFTPYQGSYAIEMQNFSKIENLILKVSGKKICADYQLIKVTADKTVELEEVTGEYACGKKKNAAKFHFAALKNLNGCLKLKGRLNFLSEDRTYSAVLLKGDAVSGGHCQLEFCENSEVTVRGKYAEIFSALKAICQRNSKILIDKVGVTKIGFDNCELISWQNFELWARGRLWLWKDCEVILNGNSQVWCFGKTKAAYNCELKLFGSSRLVLNSLCDNVYLFNYTEICLNLSSKIEGAVLGSKVQCFHNCTAADFDAVYAGLETSPMLVNKIRIHFSNGHNRAERFCQWLEDLGLRLWEDSFDRLEVWFEQKNRKQALKKKIRPYFKKLMLSC